MEFQEFQKIARLNREVIATEKIDGTNGCIGLPDDPGMPMLVGSRSRWISPDDDNFGFARWAYAHEAELRTLGPGYHYGEWWGAGIQRRYGLTEKRFSLFNVSRWGDVHEAACGKCQLRAGTFAPATCTRCQSVRPIAPTPRPACCSVVPELARGMDIREVTERALSLLRERGSLAAPWFMKPEGVVLFHTASRSLFKVTLENDAEPKGKGT